MEKYVENCKRITFIILILFSVVLSNYADDKPKRNNSRETEKANSAFKQYKFSVAMQHYKKYYSNERDKQTKMEIAKMIGLCYMRNNEYSHAENWFLKVLDNNNPEILLQLADAAKRQGKYADAKAYFMQYQREVPGDSKTETLLNYCDSALYWEANPKDIQIEKFNELNSKNNDFSPMYFKDKSVLFTSDRNTGKDDLYDWTGLPFTDIYICTYNKKKDNYNKAVPFEFSNTDFNDGVVCFNSRLTEMYFTQCNGSDGKQYNCRIMYIKKKGNSWSEPQPASFCTDSFANYGHPGLSADGKRLYFSSNKLGGYGEEKEDGKSLKTTDLYMCNFVNRAKTWGDPINLGSIINTDGNEQFPFIYKDILYFSSDGLPGMGGLDIFTSYKSDNQWTIPENLKAPLNSSADDFGIVIEKGGDLYAGYTGLFSSNRKESKKDDIYNFYIAPIKFNVRGYVTNSETKRPEPGSKVSLIYDDTILICIANENAFYEFKDIPPKTSYVVFAEKESFFSSPDIDFSTMGLKVSKDFEINLEIKPFPNYTEIFKLEGIYYGLDSFNLRPESMLVLDSLANILNKYPGLVIELAAHTDCRESYAYNMVLSQKRANACVEYLIFKGIDSRRLIPKGYGESQLVNNCRCENEEASDCTEQEHQINRRTTIAILRTDFNGLEN